MENQQIKEIKLHILNIKEWAENSKFITIGGKYLVKNRVTKILQALEIIELELMATKGK